MVVKHLRRYCHISAFRLILVLLIDLFFSYPLVWLASLIYLLLFNYKEALILIALLFVVYLRLNIRLPYLNYGQVIKINNNQVILRTSLYDIEVNDTKNLAIGNYYKLNLEIIDDYQISNKRYKLANNILYKAKLREVISSNSSLLNFTYQLAQKHNDKAYSLLRKFLFNEFVDDYLDTPYLGFGLNILTIYLIRKKNNYILAFLFSLLHLCFFKGTYHTYYLILNSLFSYLGIRKDKALFISSLIFILWQPQFIYNRVLQIFFLLRFFNLMAGRPNKYLFCLLEMYLTSSISIVRLFSRSLLILLSLFFYLLAIIILPFPCLDFILLFFYKCLAYLDFKTLTIYGCLPLPLIIFNFFLFHLFKIKNINIKIIILLFMLIFRVYIPPASFVFIDVGQGDCTLFEDRNRNFKMLIDTGDYFAYEKVKKLLHKRGITKINILLISHSDNDHAANALSICQDFRVDKIIRYKNETIKRPLLLIPLEKEKGKNENDKSLVYYLNIDKKAFLFTGDISKTIEDSIVSNYPNLPIFFLKVAHHGSKSASSRRFLQTSMPLFASISTSGKYNHPHKQTTKRFKDYKINYFVTKECGDIHYDFWPLLEIIWHRKGIIFLTKGEWQHF